MKTVNDEAQRLKEKGIDIIIVLSHCGLNVDKIMAAKCPLIDVIVGGHSHTFLYTGVKAVFLIISIQYKIYKFYIKSDTKSIIFKKSQEKILQ